MERSEFPERNGFTDSFYTKWGKSDNQNDALHISIITFSMTNVFDFFFHQQIEDSFFYLLWKAHKSTYLYTEERGKTKWKKSFLIRITLADSIPALGKSTVGKN